MSRRLMTLEEVRRATAVVVPAYFAPDVPAETVESILVSVLEDSSVYCRPDRLLVVVDRETVTERVASRLGVPLFRLDRNRGKGGAVQAGLGHLEEVTDAEYFVTRDCDGDHILEDLPRMVSLARSVGDQTGSREILVMGARPSLAKPMGWLREEWERLTNRVLVGLLEFVLARDNRILDRRFWSGMEPDIQSGYRVYSRPCIKTVVESLRRMPEDPALWTFACEFLPFADLALEGAVAGQVQRMTLVEQPVTSYGQVDLAGAYGTLLKYAAERSGVDAEALLRLFDNQVPASTVYYSDARSQIDRARLIIDPSAGPLLQSRFL